MHHAIYHAITFTFLRFMSQHFQRHCHGSIDKRAVLWMEEFGQLQSKICRWPSHGVHHCQQFVSGLLAFTTYSDMSQPEHHKRGINLTPWHRDLTTQNDLTTRLRTLNRATGQIDAGREEKMECIEMCWVTWLLPYRRITKEIVYPTVSEGSCGLIVFNTRVGFSANFN